MTNKTAIITGASGGVAQAVAAKLRTQGYRLALVTRFKARVTPGKDDRVIAADVSTPTGAGEAMAMAQAHFGHLPSVLFHCAGAGLVAPLTRTSEALYRQTMAANLDTAFFTLQSFLPALTRTGQHGAAVLFSATAAQTGTGNQVAVSAAKGAIEGLTRAVASEYAPQRVRINTVATGMMRTGMTEKLLASERGNAQMMAQYPLGRVGDASDAAAMAVWLASDEASWITGQVFTVDGGFSAIRPLVRVQDPAPGVAPVRSSESPAVMGGLPERPAMAGGLRSAALQARAR